jgi:serine phosphatase RsbU (regulator of sigma subunit)
MDILKRFEGSLDQDESRVVEHVHDFLDWRNMEASNFTPSQDDDVELRTYLLWLRTSGEPRERQRQRTASLRRFYSWASQAKLIDASPFESYNVDRPHLTLDQIRQRGETFTGEASQREIARLQAMNRLAEELNHTTDMQTTLATGMETLVKLLNLKTAWSFLLPSAGSPLDGEQIPENGFTLAATCDLPPGLERDDRFFLRKPVTCHCQKLMEAGQLKRAVNIVECTRLQDSAEHEGDNQGLMFHASVPIIASSEPLGIINVATEEWQFLDSADLQLLSAIGAQVAIALERARLYDLTLAQSQRLERQLQMARQVQDSLLPDHLPDIPGFSLAADWRSALEMAGDFYDLFPLSDGRWGLVIADVSDKGAPAALYMAMSRSLIRASAAAHPDPAAALIEVNQRLLTHSSADMFVTVFYGVLDANRHQMTYANAGQNPPLMRRASGEIESLMPTGPALSVFDDPSVANAILNLTPGDALVLYTDGVTDALDPHGENYGLERLERAFIDAPRRDAQNLLDYLSVSLQDFTRGEEPFDDITWMVLLDTRN